MQHKKKGFPLHIITTDSKFIICPVLIPKYSALLESTVNLLQATILDLLSYTDNSKKIPNIVKNYRRYVDVKIENLLKDSQLLAKYIRTTFEKTLTVKRKKAIKSSFLQRSRVLEKLTINSVFELVMSLLEHRFHNGNLLIFLLFLLHTRNMLKINF